MSTTPISDEAMQCAEELRQYYAISKDDNLTDTIQRYLDTTQTALTAAQAAVVEKDKALRVALIKMDQAGFGTTFAIVRRALSSTCGQPILDALAAAQARIKRLEAALAKISDGEGAYNRDPLKHASNVIDNLMKLAREALKGEVS